MHDHDSFRLDVGRDKQGEFFHLIIDDQTGDELIVMDMKKRLRHLLLFQRSPDKKEAGAKFLCGYDEREWFVASVPEKMKAGNVEQAMDALKPQQVFFAQKKSKVKRARRNKRKNKAFICQGEWFFLPEPGLVVNPVHVHYNEPLSRGGGKAHWVDQLYREGGVLVYMCRQFPTGLDEKKREELFKREPEAKKYNWQARTKDARVMVKGRVRHPDHKTVILDSWHEVFMSTENKASAKKHVVFLD